jgi:hypothetical protein
MASADVPVRVVRFNGPGIETFQSIGFDQQERVYAMFCKEDKGDCWLYRWDPKTGQKDALGSLTEAAERVGNMGPNQYWPNKEYIVKGHTHIWYLVPVPLLAAVLPDEDAFAAALSRLLRASLLTRRRGREQAGREPFRSAR